MADTKISPEDWKLIVRRIHSGICVPFLGAAVNVSRSNYVGLPLGAEVALRMVKDRIEFDIEDVAELAKVIPHKKLADSERYRELARAATSNLPRVSLLVEFGSDFADFVELLRSLLPDHKLQPSPMLNTLASLPFELIVTTNYDRLMERALDAKGKSYLRLVQPPAGFDEARQLTLQKELADFNAAQKYAAGNKGVILYKIHGTFTDEADASDLDKSLIITEDDYIQFLTVLGRQTGGVPNQITAKMVDSTLLFLGYSLEDWDFRTIFKGLIETLAPRKQRKSFAIQKDPSGFWEDFWQARKVKIYSIDLYEFSDELLERYQKHVKQIAQGGDDV